MLIAAAMSAAAASGQTSAVTTLIVTIHTAGGEMIPGATVRLESIGPEMKKAVHSGETDGAGVARFSDLPSGKYRLNILAGGFDELTTDVMTDPATENRVDAVMSAAHTESITVQGVIDTPLEEATTSAVLERQQVKNLPDRPSTISDALPLAPGIVRLPNGQLRLAGNGEHRSALLINSANAADPATGQFGATLPIDSVRTMNVLSSPFLAEYGGFTSDVIAVETRKGGDKWTFELNDPLPEFRWRSWHMVGLRSSTPRFSFGGPLIANKLHMLESIQYDLRATPVITLPFPRNETRREGYNSLTALDYIINTSNVLSATFHLADRHARFENLDFFNPEPVTPSTAESVFSADVTEHASFRGTLLESAITAATFRTRIWPQGLEDMTIAPTGNLGNYFSQQTRTSSRIEWRETWSFSKALHGTHNIKVGSLLGGTTEHAQITERPVNIVDTSGALLETINFTPGLPIARTDVETAFFAQDQWILGSRFSLNLGVRVEQQEVTDTFRVAPRAGFVWTPFHGGRTVVRAGTGIFYDRVPLNVFGFALYPDQIITRFNPDGSILSGPDRYFNLTEGPAPHHSPLVYRSNAPGDFSPNSLNFNIQLEQVLTSRIRLRANYLQSVSSELIVVAPEISGTMHAFALNGNGSSFLRQFEFTAAATARKEDQIFLSFVHGSSTGNLNEFSNYLANYPLAVILPDARTFLAGDTPNRFLGWGTIAFPKKFRLSPKVEYHTGFPYSSYNAMQNYVGIPNQARFPGYLSVDARITKDFKVNDKYSVRFGVSGSDLTNHFNPVSVHTNVADPAYNVFFGTYRRRYTADFDVLF
jgi:hypothetical protein